MMRAILLCAIVAYVNGQTTMTAYSSTDSTCSVATGTYTNWGSASCGCWAASSSSCTDGQYSSNSWVCHGNYVTRTTQGSCNSDCSSCTGSSSPTQWSQSEFAALKTGACSSNPDGGYFTLANGCDWVSGVCTEVDDSCPTDNNHTASIVVGVLGIVCLCACGVGLHMSSRSFYDGENEKSVEAAIDEPSEEEVVVVEEVVLPDGEGVVAEEEPLVIPDGEPVPLAYCLGCRKKIETYPDSGFCYIDEEDPSQGAVHDTEECQNAYEDSVADKCAHCGKALLPGDGFSGEVVEIEGNLVHAECQEAFVEAVDAKAVDA